MSQKETKGKKLSLREVFRSPNTIRVLICVLGTAVIIGLFEVAIVPMRYNLQVGMVPTTTISATKDVVDELSTEQRRKEAAAQVTPTYRYQEGITEQVMNDFDQIFAQLRSVRQYAGTLGDNSSTKVYTKEELQYARELLTLINLSDYQLTSLMRCKTEELEEAYTLLYAVLQSTMQGHVTQGQESTAVYNMNIVPAVLNACIRANMLIDQEVTDAAREAAREAVEPVIYKQGQNIVVRGQGRITANQLAMLSTLGLLSNGEVDMTIYVGAALLVALVMAVMLFLLAHIKDDMLRFGLPLYSTFNPWFYNTRMFDKVPIESWWDIVAGYNEETQSYKDAGGKNTQYWTIFSKDITAPSYAALWAQLISDSDKLLEQYKKQYGKDLTFTYHDHLQNTPGLMELPENNAGVELFWRFSQMTITPLADGDAVVEAVHESVNGPTLGLCSASKLDNSKQSMGESGMDIAWVTGLTPYTAQDAASYSYVVSGCDNPAGARLFIKFMMGGDDGQSGCYNVFDKLGHWSVRDDVTYKKSGITYEEVNLTAPDFEHIYQNYPNVKAYWTLWNSTR